jgi:GH24 family phage-related lysozyme (muramidase)
MIEQLREELEADEGSGNGVIYLDHLNLKTCGIGHLCKKGDPEFVMAVGTPVSEERVAELFKRDIAWTITDCQRLFPNFDELPEEVRLICANMMFNMGATKMAGFRKFKIAVEDAAWQTAALEMHDSRWRQQVPNRAERLIARMRGI